MGGHHKGEEDAEAQYVQGEDRPVHGDDPPFLASGQGRERLSQYDACRQRRLRCALNGHCCPPIPKRSWAASAPPAVAVL